jgi:hypothetical protein
MRVKYCCQYDRKYNDTVNGDCICIIPRVRYGLTDHWGIFAERIAFVNNPINGH